MCVVLCCAAGAGEREDALNLIPPPQVLSLEGGVLPLAAEDRSAAVLVIPGQPDKKEAMAAEWIAREIAALSGARPEIARGPSGLDLSGKRGKTRVVLATFDRKTQILKKVAPLLDDDDRQLLSNPGEPTRRMLSDPATAESPSWEAQVKALATAP
jgi:hypothetical protein